MLSHFALENGPRLLFLMRRPSPQCVNRPWPLGETFVNKCTHGVASYVIVRVLTTIVALITALTDTYVLYSCVLFCNFVFAAPSNVVTHVSLFVPPAQLRGGRVEFQEELCLCCLCEYNLAGMY